MQRKILSLLSTVLYIGFSLYVISSLWEVFFNTCPNKDFLTWDPELRYIYTLDLLDHLRTGNLSGFLFQILDTPTWPPLRNLFQMFWFGLLGHSPLLDVKISLGVFLLLGFVLFFLGIKNRIGILWTISFPALLFLSPALLLYAFSGMLEIQGGLFLTLSSLYLGFFLLKKKDERTLIVPFFLSVLALYFTKYPYGYMFFLSSLGILIFLYPKPFLGLIKIYSKEKLSFHIPFFLGLFFLLVLLLIPEAWKIGKTTRYIKYSTAIFFFMQAIIFLFSKKQEILSVFPKFYYASLCIFLPIGFWTLSHPDRFGSSNSTLNHIQVDGFQVGEKISRDLNYYLHLPSVLFGEAWIHPYMGFVLGILVGISCIIGFYKYFKNKQIRIYFLLNLILWSSLFGLIVATPNHQGRHVYHLIPLVILILMFFIKEEKAIKSLSYFFGLLLLVLGFFLAQNKIWIREPYLCFAGVGDLYSPPKFFQKTATELITTDFYLLNLIEEGHLHRADSEYVLKKYAYDHKLKMLQKKKNQVDLPVIVLSKTCLEEKALKEVLKGKERQATRSIENGCMEKWDTIRPLSPP